MRKTAYDPFDKIMDAAGSGERYFFGLPKISPGGQDGMAGHPDAIGGNRTAPIKGVTPKNKHFPGKKSDKTKYRMKKTAQFTTSISSASGSKPRESYVLRNIVAGPSKVTTEQKIPRSGPAMPRYHKQSLTAPLKNSANMRKTASIGSFSYGFCDELVNLI